MKAKPVAPPGQLHGDEPLVALVLVNFNGLHHLRYSLPSLMATSYPRLLPIIVDNGSTDGSAEHVSDLWPQAVLIRASRNLGYSRGCNAGIGLALRRGAEYIAVVNNDIRVHPLWLRLAIEFANADPAIGVVGYPCWEGGDAAEWSGWVQSEPITCNELEASQRRFVHGMAMVIRSELLREIGLFDEGFFAYGEENDLQIRARKAGYRVVELNIPIWHLGEGTSGRTRLRAAFWQTRHNIRLLLKHAGLLETVRRGMGHVRKRLLARSQGSPDPAERRLSYSNRLMRVGLLVAAVAWNLLVLPATLRRRWVDNRRCAQARCRREQQLR